MLYPLSYGTLLRFRGLTYPVALLLHFLLI